MSTWEFKIDAPNSMFAVLVGTNPFTVRLEIDEIDARFFIQGVMYIPPLPIDTFCAQGAVGISLGAADGIVFGIL